MKHAGPEALDALDGLIAAVRALGAFNEKGRGVFYRGGKAALHFREDPAGLFADWRAAGEADFARFPVGTGGERAAFLAAVKAAIL